MKEIFVIYNKNSGFIDGGCGRVERKAKPDGSTMAERIPEILAKNLDREVVYLPNQSLPDPEKHKISNGKIVEMNKGDLVNFEATKPKSEIELLRERVQVLESQSKA